MTTATTLSAGAPPASTEGGGSGPIDAGETSDASERATVKNLSAPGAETKAGDTAARAPATPVTRGVAAFAPQAGGAEVVRVGASGGRDLSGGSGDGGGGDAAAASSADPGTAPAPAVEGADAPEPPLGDRAVDSTTEANGIGAGAPDAPPTSRGVTDTKEGVLGTPREPLGEAETAEDAATKPVSETAVDRLF